MNALALNEKTGFLESKNPTFSTFDSARKLRFLEIANEILDKDEMFSVYDICKAVDINMRTFSRHLALDEKFREEWEQTLDRIEDTLVKTMVCQGKKPGGYMDRITWLRAHRPQKWHPDLRVQIGQDMSLIQKVSSGIKEYIDAEIVDNPSITSTQP